jgi:hypothetical protein
MNWQMRRARRQLIERVCVHVIWGLPCTVSKLEGLRTIMCKYTCTFHISSWSRTPSHHGFKAPSTQVPLHPACYQLVLWPHKHMSLSSAHCKRDAAKWIGKKVVLGGKGVVARQGGASTLSPGPSGLARNVSRFTVSLFVGSGQVGGFCI